VRIVVVGGSASNVGKTRLAERLVGEESREGATLAMKVSVRETPCAMRILIFRHIDDGDHRLDSARLLRAERRWWCG
jgi:hypothetical protein